MRLRITAIKRSFNPTAFLLAVFCLGAGSFLWAYDLDQKKEISSKKPVNITASQLTFDRLKGLTVFKDKVHAVHEPVVLDADLLRSIEGNKEAAAEGHVKVVDHGAAMTLTCGSLEYLDLMNTMTAHDHPLLVSLDEDGIPITIRGRQMELDSLKKTVVINQNVEIVHQNGKAEAQKATYYSSEEKFVLEEQPRVFTTNGQITGRRIVSKLGGDRSVIAEGMADAIFNPSGPVTGISDKKSTSSTSGPADGPAAGPSAPQGGPNDPGAVPTPSPTPDFPAGKAFHFGG